MNSPAASELHLAQAVTRAQAGDQAAMEAIFQRFADPLYRYLRARSGDAALAEELSGELWVRVVANLGTFRLGRGAPDALFSAWLYRIARNLVADSFRKERSPSLPLEETVPSRDAEPHEVVLAEEEKREVRAALAQLTPDQREILLLRFVEEQSPAEVAELVKKSEGAVRITQFRALETLARLLGVRRDRRR
jgi:RNA polymerase sigma-70 factor (ECF subfamily)